MLDFKELLNRTPEERRAVVDKVNSDYASVMHKRVADRIKMLTEIQESSVRFNEWEQTFIETLQGKATAVERISGEIGGTLSFMTEKQVEKLQDLHAVAINQTQPQPTQTLYPQRQR